MMRGGQSVINFANNFMCVHGVNDRIEPIIPIFSQFRHIFDTMTGCGVIQPIQFPPGHSTTLFVTN